MKHSEEIKHVNINPKTDSKCQHASSYSETCLSGHSNIDKTKVLKTGDSLMHGSKGSILQYFRPALSDYRS